MGAPKHIQLEPEAMGDEKIIIGHIDGIAHFMTREDAISLINELSGVLLAHEYRTGYKQCNTENAEDLRSKSG